jgi:hypothetical protein
MDLADSKYAIKFNVRLTERAETARECGVTQMTLRPTALFFASLLWQ